MRRTKGYRTAQQLLFDCGIDDTTDFPLDLLVAGRGVTLIFRPLTNCDGRIIFGEKKSIITVNSKLEFEGRRRFTIAHELGHYEMHRDSLEIHNDNQSTLSWFDDKVSRAKTGIQELEANQFATELLMPKSIFLKECSTDPFSPELVRRLSSRFKTSITSIVFRYLELGKHPICIFHTHKNRVKYWKRSNHFNHFIKDIVKLPPPEDSVAAEFFENSKIYKKRESKQPIWKSTWCELSDYESDQEYNFFEYCIITPRYNTVISVVWEEI